MCARLEGAAGRPAARAAPLARVRSSGAFAADGAPPCANRPLLSDRRDRVAGRRKRSPAGASLGDDHLRQRLLTVVRRRPHDVRGRRRQSATTGRPLSASAAEVDAAIALSNSGSPHTDRPVVHGIDAGPVDDEPSSRSDSYAAATAPTAMDANVGSGPPSGPPPPADRRQDHSTEGEQRPPDMQDPRSTQRLCLRVRGRLDAAFRANRRGSPLVGRRRSSAQTRTTP